MNASSSLIPSAQRTARSDGEDTRARLLLAALRLFSGRGYAQTSVRAIADQVAMLHGGLTRWTGTVAEMDTTTDPYVSQFIHGRAEGPIAAIR